jgi:hypothetical protein
MTQPQPDRIVLLVRALVQDLPACQQRLADALAAVAEELGFTCYRQAGQGGTTPTVLALEGPGIAPLAAAESGVHIFCSRQENLLPVQVSMYPAGEADVSRQVAALCAQREAWLADVAGGAASADADPWPLGPIVRFYDDEGPTLDLRTGRSLPRFPTVAQWRSLVLAGLPLPGELND